MFVGIFNIVRKCFESMQTEAASHFQEDFMTNFPPCAQIIPQIPRYTFVRPQENLIC